MPQHDTPDHAGIHWRLSSSLGPSGEQLTRHAFPDLNGQIAEAACQHWAFRDKLLPDDDQQPLCMACCIALGTSLADQLGDRRPLD